VKILALYTAGDPASVALRTPGREGAREIPDRSAVEALVASAAELLRESGLRMKELDGVALARGPGSFTGLRVGAAAALGLARGGRVPLFAVGTLETWAVAAFADPRLPSRCHVALDARRGEVYLGTFEAATSPSGSGGPALPITVAGPRALPVADAALRLEPGVPVVGDGRDLLLGSADAADRAGFARPSEPLSLWLVRLVVGGSVPVMPLDDLALDYLRQPQAVARAAAGRGGAP
jgi:tRNA threonylcarbamoyladenosine biosynthesis protein TsaB